MLDLGKKEKEKKNERDDFISYLVQRFLFYFNPYNFFLNIIPLLI